MELTQWKERLASIINQYKYVLLLIAAGIILLMFPANEKPEKQGISQQQENIITVEQQLSEILSCVRGAGEVKVFLSRASGEEILYQTDENYSTSTGGYDNRIDTVTVSGSDREETGLIRQINPPTYLGAIIVCQGADDPVIRLAIVEAVSRVTGLGADRISVLKMR